MIEVLIAYLAIFLYLAIGVIIYAVPNKLWPDKCKERGFEGEGFCFMVILLWPLVIPFGLIYIVLVWLYDLIMDA